MRRSLIAAAGLLAACNVQWAGAVDSNPVRRPIKQQPDYNSKQPLYGLVVIGVAQETSIWIVLDQSEVDGQQYDLLYADLNGNGNLTEAQERFTAIEGSFALPEITDAVTGKVHSEFRVRISKNEPPTQMVSLMWQGERKIGGGYPEHPDDGYMQFAPSITGAPILFMNGDGPFRFQRWYSEQLTIGGSSDLKVFLGLPGVGPNSFCAFQRHVLPPDEPVHATLVYTDVEGAQQQAVSELKERC